MYQMSTDHVYSMASLDLLAHGPVYKSRPLHKFKKQNRLENAIHEQFQIFLYFLPMKIPNQNSRPQMKSLDSSCRKLVTVSYLSAKQHFNFVKSVNLKDIEEQSRDNVFRVIGNSYRSEIPSLMSMQKLDHDSRVIAAYLLLARERPFFLRNVQPLLQYRNDDFLSFVAQELSFAENTLLSDPNEWANLLEKKIDFHREKLFRNELSQIAVTALPSKATTFNYFVSNVCYQDEIIQKNLRMQKDDMSLSVRNLGLEMPDSQFYVDIRPIEVNEENTYKVLVYADADEILSFDSDSD